VKGLSGSGKSSLIESQKFEEDGWVFATGKYEGRRKHVPYSALIDALDSLVDQWLINNKNARVCEMASLKRFLDEDLEILENILPKTFHDVKAWKKRAESCPKLTSEIRPMAEVKDKAKCEAQCGSGNVNAAFWRILSFLCGAKPVVLFLDDIQWADQASLDAIQVLASAGNIKGFLLVLSYREEEVNEGDSVSKCLDFIDEEGERVETIHVTDLDVENTNKIVASLLNKESEPERTMKLTKVIHSKTAGNPFFVVQFLYMLRNESFLKFNFMTFQWEWGNIDKMDQLAYISDNVADVIAASMSKLPQACLLALQKASCLGKVIPMQVIVEYFRRLTEENVCEPLKTIQTKGLQKIFDCAVEFGILTRLDEGETFMWAHDKLQYVAYSMIPAEYLQSSHKSFGIILWEMHKLNPDKEWMLYMAADQLNHLTDVDEDGLREDIARLSFQAGQLSISKAAFFPALDMVRFAAKRLGEMENSWEAAYELSLDVYSTLAELSIQFASYEEAISAAIRVDRHAETLEDKFRAEIVFVRHKVEGSNRDFPAGIEHIKNILLDYGVKFPTTIFPGRQYLENRKLKARLGGSAENFLSIPKVDERTIEGKRSQIILTLLTQLVEYTFYIEKLWDVHVYAFTRVLNVSLKEGCTNDTAMAMACFGGLLGKNGRNEESREWLETAIKLVDSFPVRVGSRHSLVHSWRAWGLADAGVPLHNMIEPILELNRFSLRNGDVQEGCMAWIGYAYVYLSVGLPLDPLNSDVVSFSNEARQFGIPATIKILLTIFRQVIQNLKVLKPNPTMLEGDIFDQEKDLKKFKDAGLRMTLRDINSFRLMLACIFQEWETAADLISELEPFFYLFDKWGVRRHVFLVYMGLGSTFLGEKTNGKNGLKFRQLGKKILKIFKGMLKDGFPDALPIVMMLEAIKSPSKKRFDEAIRTAARLGLVHYEAILYENAGLFFMDNGDQSWAEYYLSESTKLFAEWGAHGKTAQMMVKYGFLHSSSFIRKVGGNLHGRTRFSPAPIDMMKAPITSSITNIGNYDEKEE